MITWEREMIAGEEQALVSGFRCRVADRKPRCTWNVERRYIHGITASGVANSVEDAKAFCLAAIELLARGLR